MEGLTLSPLKLIPNEKGNVMHALKATDSTFVSFGEAYFSTVIHGIAKGWKRHNRMTLNLVVPAGAIRFVVVDDRGATPEVFETVLGPEVNYQRLTVEPGLWVAFQGVGDGLNLLLNLASIPHDPTESDSLPLDDSRLGAHNWDISQLG
jgi:dTDP-4-dehydrorhamnose 3,5-epimerase